MISLKYNVHVTPNIAHLKIIFFLHYNRKMCTYPCTKCTCTVAAPGSPAICGLLSTRCISYMYLKWFSFTSVFSYRCFSMEHPTATKTKSSEGFIDGDLVEHFLDLPQDKMEEICKGIKVHVASTWINLSMFITLARRI